MEVESTYLQGTTFSFTLPWSPELQFEQQESRLKYPQSVVQVRAQERVIVVVHNDPQIALLLQRYMDNCRVVSVSDIHEGITKARELQAVAVVTASDSDALTATDNMLFINCPLPESRNLAAPLGATDALTKPISPDELRATIARLNRPIRRILIADDDPDMVRLYRRILRTDTPELECLEAYNGAEALSLIRQEKPDLVLLDLAMPEMDGEEVLRELATTPTLAEIPVIIASARIEDFIGPQLSGSIQISRAAGFLLGEIVKTLETTVTTLAPGWD